MTPSRTVLTTGAIAASAALVLSGCGSGASGAESGELSVVTSTNVYADIVSQIAGDFAEVTAVIDDPNQDPHSYEATTQHRLKLSKADLGLENRGGHDALITTMMAKATSTIMVTTKRMPAATLTMMTATTTETSTSTCGTRCRRGCNSSTRAPPTSPSACPNTKTNTSPTRRTTRPSATHSRGRARRARPRAGVR